MTLHLYFNLITEEEALEKSDEVIFKLYVEDEDHTFYVSSVNDDHFIVKVPGNHERKTAELDFEFEVLVK